MPKMLPGIRDAQMISAARLLSVIAMLNLCWLECAQNPAVFCYRIGWDLLATLCAIAGDQLGYWIGRRAGQALYRRPDSAFFKRRHLERAHDFYEKYGGKTVILARFMPIVRTFCPLVAGAAQMRYSRYLSFDILGGCCWGAGLVLGGYFLGSVVPNISQRIHWVIAVVVILSFLPAMIGAIRSRWRRISKPDAVPLGP